MQREARASSSFTESKTTFALNRFDDFTFRQVRQTTQFSCRILTPQGPRPKNQHKLPKDGSRPRISCGVVSLFYFCDY